MALKDVKVKEHARKKIQNEIKELTLNIFQLKVYDIILKWDEFGNEEILPSIDGSCKCKEEEEEVREAEWEEEDYSNNTTNISLNFSSKKYIVYDCLRLLSSFHKSDSKSSWHTTS